MNTPLSNYLDLDSHSLGTLFHRLKQLKQWNGWLKESLQDQLVTEHCQIVGLQKFSLIVVADNPHWVTRFRFFIPGLLLRLKKYPDFRDINSICCKTRPSQIQAPFVKKPKKTRLTISAENAEILLATAEKIQDVRLRGLMEKIARHGK